MADLGLDLNLKGLGLDTVVQKLPELISDLRRGYLSEVKINTFMNIMMEKPS